MGSLKVVGGYASLSILSRSSLGRSVRGIEAAGSKSGAGVLDGGGGGRWWVALDAQGTAAFNQ